MAEKRDLPKVDFKSHRGDFDRWILIYYTEKSEKKAEFFSSAKKANERGYEIRDQNYEWVYYRVYLNGGTKL